MATIETDLHIRIWGEGNAERVVLLHGANVPDPEQTWQAQRPLAEEYELVVVYRRGFGGSPSAERMTWKSQIADLLTLVGERAHVVGHSYGAVLALLFASQYPERVRSLVAIEPPAFGLALDDSAIAALVARLAPVHLAGPDLPPEEFLRRFVAAQGEELPADFTLALRTAKPSTLPASRPIRRPRRLISNVSPPRHFPNLSRPASGRPKWRLPATASLRCSEPSAPYFPARTTARNG